MVLVFRSGRGVRGNVAVFRNRYALAGDIFTQAALEGTNGCACALRRWPVWFLCLGRTHVREWPESIHAAGVFHACVLAGCPRVAASCLLVRHTVERKDALYDRDALRAGIRL